jgi:hypothetical protein
MDLLKLTRAYTTEDGVTLHMLPYDTHLDGRVGKQMRAAMSAVKDEGQPLMTEEEATYTLCLALTIQVDLPPDPPVWAIILKDFLSDRSCLQDPVKGWYRLEAIAPTELYTHWWQAQKSTRPVELMAVPELQGTPPAAVGAPQATRGVTSNGAQGEETLDPTLAGGVLSSAT